MSNVNLLEIDPKELQFPFELKKKLTCFLKLSNTSDNYVAFKAKVTNPKKYCVRPTSGVVSPHSSYDVKVTMHAQEDVPPDMKCKDKFMFQSVVARSGASDEDITAEMFHKESGNHIEEFKLRVSYVPPPISNGDLLQFDPTELQFPFELNKNITCPLKLSNKSNDHVAFKVSTTNPKNCCVRPNRGVILPRSTCDVLVTMQRQKVAPTNLLCKDKFKIQSVVVNPGTSADDITQKLFTKEPGNHVEEGKLRVSYGPPPQPPSLVQEGSEGSTSPNAREVTEEVLSPKVSDKYSVNASVFKSAKLKASDWRGKLSENMQKLFGTGEATGVNGVVAKTGAWRKIAAQEQEQLLKDFVEDVTEINVSHQCESNEERMIREQKMDNLLAPLLLNC